MKARIIKETAVKKEILVEQPDRSFVICAKNSDLALTAEAGGQVVLRQNVKNEAQIWKFHSLGKTDYALINHYTGKALDLVALGTENGTAVQQWEPVDSVSQTWTVEACGNYANHTYQIASKLSGKVLDIAGMERKDGAHVQIWENVSGDNQIWEIQQI